MLRLIPISSLCYSFLAILPRVAADAAHYSFLKGFQNGILGEVPSQTFFSSPLKAPIWQRAKVNKLDLDKIDDTRFIFITGGYDSYGPSIISSKDLSLIWADNNYYDSQAFRTYTLFDKPVIGVFAGGGIQIYDESYNLVHRVTGKGDFWDYNPDSHEALITTNNTAVMIIGKGEKANLTHLGQGEEDVTNNYIQEVEIGGNKVLFQFNMRDYFNPEDSYWPWHGSGPYDFGWAYDMWHTNSVEKLPNGDFLVSSRHLHSIFLLDGKTAKVKWVLGGKRNEFKDITKNGSGEFHWQHNARLTAPNRITFFDNHDIFNGYCNESEKGCSRGLEIEFNEDEKTYWVVNEWYHPQSLITASRGGVNRTPKNNTLVAWGQNPMYTEHAPDGEVVMDIQRGQVLPLDHGIGQVIAYRAWKADWVGKPKWPPSIAADTDDAGVTSIYVSWNGATEVDKYVMLASNRSSRLNGKDSIIATSDRTGFETPFVLDQKVKYARIAALDRNGTILGFTSAVNTETGEIRELKYALDDLSTSKKAEQEALAAAKHDEAVQKSRTADGPALAFIAIWIAIGFTAVVIIMWANVKPLGANNATPMGRGLMSSLFSLIKLRTIRRWNYNRDLEEEEGLVDGEEKIS
ncbi:Arylsulfotransferase-domain-containing protein [Xylariaceae sp. FL1272]|nr:Arylsulfotransferase-domain-containing protein [Xylariaceae sp. FL1272]